MLVNNERKRGAIKSVVRIFVEEDVIGRALTAPDCVPVEQRQYRDWAKSLFSANNSVTLFTSEDVRLQVYANVDSSKRENYCKKMADELRLSFIAFGGDVDDQQFLQVAQTSDRLTLIDIHILKNIVCLLKQDCEAVITFYDGFREIYERFLRNYGVSVLSLSEEFHINTIRSARYEWIERHLTSDPPNSSMANEMTYQVIRRFAEDEGTDCNPEFLAVAFSQTLENIRQINEMWNNFDPRCSLRRQSIIFQEVENNYQNFCEQVGWSIQGVYQSTKQLQDRLRNEPISSLPDGFLPFLFHRKPTDTASELESIYVAWLVRIQEGLSL